MIIYLFAVQEEQRISIKQIHKYACDYLLDWFSKLGSYSGFSNQSLLDSTSIITCQEIKNRDKVANGLFSTAILRVRKPIEALFNWLIQKTDIQIVSKVRTSKGLLIHNIRQNCFRFYKLNF